MKSQRRLNSRFTRAIAAAAPYPVPPHDEKEAPMPCMSTGFTNYPLRIALAVVMLTCSSAPLADALKSGRQGEYTLVSGGNSDSEVAELQKLAPRYQIQLLFKHQGDKSGMSGVRVGVRNTAGDLMVEATSTGPYMYVNPPSGGRYTIEAEYQGETLTRTRDLVGRRYLQLEFDFGTEAAAK